MVVEAMMTSATRSGAVYSVAVVEVVEDWPSFLRRMERILDERVRSLNMARAIKGYNPIVLSKEIVGLAVLVKRSIIN
jgi:hypothetical protein